MKAKTTSDSPEFEKEVLKKTAMIAHPVQIMIEGLANQDRSPATLAAADRLIKAIRDVITGHDQNQQKAA